MIISCIWKGQKVPRSDLYAQNRRQLLPRNEKTPPEQQPSPLPSTAIILSISTRIVYAYLFCII